MEAMDGEEGRGQLSHPSAEISKITTQNAPLAWQDSGISDHTLTSLSAMLGTREQRTEE